MKLYLTCFKNIFDNNTSRIQEFDSWQHLCIFLEKLSRIKGFKPKKDEPLRGRKPSPLISPATYEPGTTRANKNVVNWAGWFAVDVDSYVFKDPKNFENELKEKFGQYEYVCYSTASSTIEHPKFRMVFPLTNYIQNKDIKDFWYAINTELDSAVDKQTKDLSRLFYVPADYPGAFNFFFRNPGKYIDPKEMIEKHPNPKKESENSLFSMSDSVRAQIINLNMSKCNNLDYSWSSYKDCPFVNKKMVTDYTLTTSTGWYHKLYTMMCSIASNAKRKGYPISAREIAILCKEIDRDNGSWYQNRPLEMEASRAIAYAYGR